MIYIFNLIGSESFISHELAQIVHLQLFVQDLLSDRSNLIDFDDCLRVERLSLPFVEVVADLG